MFFGQAAAAWGEESFRELGHPPGNGCPTISTARLLAEIFPGFEPLRQRVAHRGGIF
jgi:hypothetical protein